MHPPFPLVERLENVPRGQGKKKFSKELLCIILNPEPKRAEVSKTPSFAMGPRIASSCESMGFLGDNKSIVFRRSRTIIILIIKITISLLVIGLKKSYFPLIRLLLDSLLLGSLLSD